MFAQATRITIMDKTEALKLALEALEAAEELAAKHDAELEYGFRCGIIIIKEALAQPEQEPPTFDEWTSDYVRDNLHKLKAQPEQPKPMMDDTQRLDALAKNYWDLRCFSMSDDDVGWQVVEHHMAKPQERVVAEVFRDDPRQAINAAVEAAHNIKAEA